jgi:hypothetical protein
MKTLIFSLLLLLAPAAHAQSVELLTMIERAKAGLPLTPVASRPPCGSDQAGWQAPAWRDIPNPTPPAPPADTPPQARPAASSILPLNKADDAEFQPTPMLDVEQGLWALNPQPGSDLAVYGSGLDARWEIRAATKYPGVSVVGIEIDPEIAESARRYVAQARLSDRITIVTADATKFPVVGGYGCAYLWPETLEALKPKIAKLTRFVSYAHEVPGGVPGMQMRQVGDCYLYEKVVMQPYTYTPSSGVYGGRTYSRAYIYNGCNCSMHQALKAQLEPRTVLRPVVVGGSAPPQPSGHWERKPNMVKRCHGTWCEMVPNGTFRNEWVED